MKKKTKKILAGLALGVVGATALTGCAMTDEQQNALDKVVGKTDELVELIDKNMQYQNSQLSKQEAAEKLLIARNMFEFSKLDEFKITAILTNYVGYFDKKENETNSTVFYKNNMNSKQIAQIGSYVVDSVELNYLNYKKSDFLNNQNYTYSKSNSDPATFSVHEYISSMWNMLPYLQVTQTDVLENVTADNIVNIQIVDGGYKFDLHMLDYIDDTSTIIKYDVTVTLIDNKIKANNISAIAFQFPAGSLDEFVNEDGKLLVDADYLLSNVRSDYLNVSSYKACLTYEYDNIDFTDFDAKFAEIEAEYLTQN